MKVRINPKRTAVLVLDVQNDLVRMTPRIHENRILENIAAVIGTARRKKMPVIHITASVRGDFLDIPRDSPLWDGLRKSRQLIFGTKGAAIHPKVRPLKRELVLNKTCVDPFLTTNLGQALQNHDVNTVVLTGLWTNWVVEATARHASDMGYRVYIPRQCVASNTFENHDFAINRILPTICYIVNVKDVLVAMRG
ncbi:MAG: cysteine hydrolase [Betaproteobacteria bacterium]|nr:cysteine hydrolase [Betaproteobacteria bacterium]MDH3437989.1 cysteine hydrolase [Betaproteobacteria bacterium]